MSSAVDTQDALSILENIKSDVQGCHKLDPSTWASVVTKISQLRDAVETPLDTVLRLLTQVHTIRRANLNRLLIRVNQPMQNVALRVSVELGLLAALSESPHQALSPQQLASKASVTCGSKAADFCYPNQTIGGEMRDDTNHICLDMDPDLIDKNKARNPVRRFSG